MLGDRRQRISTTFETRPRGEGFFTDNRNCPFETFPTHGRCNLSTSDTCSYDKTRLQVYDLASIGSLAKTTPSSTLAA